MKALYLSLAILTAAGAAGAQEFSLVMVTAADLRSLTDRSLPAPSSPSADLSALAPAEAGAYLADAETPAGVSEKAAESGPALGGDGVLKLRHQWTGETLEVRYRGADGRYIPEAFAKVKHLMRCRLTGREADVPAGLLEILDALQDRFGGRTVTVICGYRSPELNGALASASDGVAKASLHLRGLAADIRIEGVRTSALRDAAKALKAGGVGYYPSDGFVHVDAGRVRYW